MHTHRYAKQTPHKVLIRHIRDDQQRGESFFTLHSQDRLPFTDERCYNGIIGFKFPYPGCKVVGSCNGIIYLYHFHIRKATVWNPSMRRKLELPGRVIAFRGTGFGFDPITDDYKVVRIPYIQSGQLLMPRGPEVYTIKTGVWSEITSPVPSYDRIYSFACFFNGAFHWVVEGFNLDHFIVTLDINTYVFSTVELPEPLRGQERSTRLTIIRESLAVSSWNSDSVSIWVLNGSIWALVYKLKNPNCGRLREINRVLQMTDNGDFLLRTHDGGFKVNPVTGQQCKLVRLSNDPCCDLETYTGKP